MTHLKIRDTEARQIGHRPSKQGFIAVLDFGPRYRGVRGPVKPTFEDAKRHALDELAFAYRQRATITVHTVNPSGRILASETVSA